MKTQFAALDKRLQSSIIRNIDQLEIDNDNSPNWRDGDNFNDDIFLEISYGSHSFNLVLTQGLNYWIIENLSLF